MRDRNEYPAGSTPTEQTRYLPGEPPGAARAAGLTRLSRLTWRVTQLGAITAVGFATIFARSAPAPMLSGHAAPALATKPASPTATPSASSAPRKHRKTSTARPDSQRAGQPTPQPASQPKTSQPTAKATRSAAPAHSPTLAPPATAPAAAPSTAAPAPAPTVSSASTGHG